MEKDDLQIRKRLRQLKLLTKYGISALAFLATAHCLLLLFGLDMLIMHVLFLIYGLCLGYSLSRMFNLCRVHKLSIIYVCCVLACIVLKRYDVFEGFLHEARIVILIFGILIVTGLLWKGTRNCLKN